VLGKVLTEIDVIVSGLSANSAQLGHLMERRDTLTALHDELEALNVEQEALKAKAQQVTAQIEAKIQVARTEMRLLRHGIRAVYGEDTQKLEEFGIRVR
jgi:uncharacterized protein YydD (DUF2326 family)